MNQYTTDADAIKRQPCPWSHTLCWSITTLSHAFASQKFKRQSNHLLAGDYLQWLGAPTHDVSGSQIVCY